MEWIEITAKTVEDAKDLALDELGVLEEEAEFEVVEQPKPGLFGRIRSEARVRARVAPAKSPAKRERRPGRRRDSAAAAKGATSGGDEQDKADKGGSGEGRSGKGRSGGGRSGGGGSTGGRSGDIETNEAEAKPATRGSRDGSPRGAPRRNNRSRTDSPASAGRGGDDKGAETVNGAASEQDAEGAERDLEVAEDFLRGFLEAAEVEAAVERRELDGDFVELAVVGEQLGAFIGPKGQTLAALQELTRTVVQRQSRGRAGRVVLDVGGYRQARREALERFTHGVAEQVISSGVARVLEPMGPADRKVVHDACNAIDGVKTISEGEDANRRVVIQPDPDEGEGD